MVMNVFVFRSSKNNTEALTDELDKEVMEELLVGILS